jgi:hypothetical protein
MSVEMRCRQSLLRLISIHLVTDVNTTLGSIPVMFPFTCICGSILNVVLLAYCRSMESGDKFLGSCMSLQVFKVSPKSREPSQYEKCE